MSITLEEIAMKMDRHAESQERAWTKNAEWQAGVITRINPLESYMAQRKDQDMREKWERDWAEKHPVAVAAMPGGVLITTKQMGAAISAFSLLAGLAAGIYKAFG